MKKVINTILLILTILLMVFCFFNIKSNLSFENERKIVNKQIDSLYKVGDSLNKVDVGLQYNYNILQRTSIKDSIIIDSLGNLIDLQNDRILKAENKSKFYLNKYNNDNNSFKYDTIYLEGDDLLKSLYKKLN
jgi:hypothetical protein